jgi:hypothetical protein
VDDQSVTQRIFCIAWRNRCEVWNGGFTVRSGWAHSFVAGRIKGLFIEGFSKKGEDHYEHGFAFLRRELQ